MVPATVKERGQFFRSRVPKALIGASAKCLQSKKGKRKRTRTAHTSWILNKFYRWFFFLKIFAAVFLLTSAWKLSTYVDKAIKTVTKTLVKSHLCYLSNMACGLMWLRILSLIQTRPSSKFSLYFLEIIKTLEKDCGLKCTSNLWHCFLNGTHSMNMHRI